MTSVVLRESNEPAPIWTKRKREPAAAYAAFVVYRDQEPPRSLARLARALGKGKRALAEWSRTYDWVERADAWTGHLVALADTVTEDAIVQRRREEIERMFEIGDDLQRLGHYRVTGAKDAKGKEVVRGLHPDELDADEAIRSIVEGTKLKRLSMGLPTDLTGTVTVSLPDLQRILESFIALAEKRMTPEAHEALVRDCYAMVRETLGG